MYKSQKDFLQPISEFQWEIWLFCFHWLNCSFHSFLGNFSPRRGFENLSTSRAIYIQTELQMVVNLILQRTEFERNYCLL